MSAKRPDASDPFTAVADLDATLHFLEDREASLPRDMAVVPAPDGPLSGWLVGVKANFAVAGQAWTAGIGSRTGFIAEADAALVARLRAAGAHIVSRLLMDEGALGAASDTPHFGRCENPAWPGHSAGGSSGGSAAAVAAGAVTAALGSDTMGSVRIPAAYCGVYGLKLEQESLPTAGLFPLAPSLDAPGLFAATPGRLAVLLDTLAPGKPPVPEITDWLSPDPAVPGACHPDVGAFFDTIRARLAEVLGPPGAAPDLSLVRTRKDAFLLTEVEAVESLAQTADLSPGLSGLLAYGRSVPAGKLMEAQVRMSEVARRLRVSLGRTRVLLLPTVAAPAFAHGTPPPPGQADFTALANVADLPALAIPAPGARPPVSAQLVGPPGSAQALVDLAARLLPAA